jgi:alpha-tubulin suppressor-like RCC1 family protein
VQAGLPANVTQVAGNCALSSDGSVRCWGPGGSGQIGNGQTNDQTTPQLVQPLGKATWIGSGGTHVCAILADQSFWCWGKDGFFSPIDYGPSPLPVSGVGKIASAACNYDNTCVIETNNTVKCWGSNLSGVQLGTNGPTGNGLSPVVIPGIPGSP